MSVYTVQIFVGQLPVSWAEFYTVPAAHIVILRDLEIQASSASSSPLTLSLQKSSGGSAGWFARPSITANDSIQWQGRIALLPGDQLWANAGAANIGAILTGYDFPYP